VNGKLVVQRAWGRQWIIYTLVVATVGVVTIGDAEPLTLVLAATVRVVVIADGVQGWRTEPATAAAGHAVDGAEAFEQVNDDGLTPTEYDAWLQRVRYR
jgi:hypothetical protein